MTGRIFMSYRLADTAAQASWLADRLAGHFGSQQVVKDVDSAQAAADIPELIANAVASCDVLLALIGHQWLTAPTQHGAQSLADPSDVVRLEIESAMTRGIQIVPVLIDGAPIPSAGELPPSLAALTRLQPLELSPQRPDLDAARLLQVLDQRIAERQASRDSVAGGQATITAQPPTPRPSASQPASGQPATGRTKPMPQRRQTRAIALVTGGVVVVAAALVAFLVVPGGKPVPSAASSASAAKQHHQSLHKAGTSPSAAFSSGLAASSKVIATDDFSTKKINWTDDSNQTAGEYTGGGVYRLSVTGYNGQNELARPADATNGLGDATPMNLSLSVDARKLSGAPQGYGYGLAFRSDGSGDFYAFVVEDHAVAIQKWVGHGAEVKGSPPAVTTSALHVDAADRLQAVCETVDGGQAVHMEFWLNGKKLVDYTDRDHPYTQGYLGLYVESISDAPSTAASEFDNFTAAQL